MVSTKLFLDLCTVISFRKKFLLLQCVIQLWGIMEKWLVRENVDRLLATGNFLFTVVVIFSMFLESCCKFIETN